MANNKKNKGVGIGIWALILSITLTIMTFYGMLSEIEKETYTDLCNYIKNKEVETLTISETHAIAKLKNDKKEIRVAILSREILYEDVGQYIREQRDAGTLKEIAEQPAVAPWWWSGISTLVLIASVVGFWIIISRMQGGPGKPTPFGRAKTKTGISDKPNTTFKDVAGADEAKEELEEIVEFLKSPQKFIALGARIPRGVLLVGPPGTGKTLLAKAIAGEAEAPFFSISGSDFVEMFVGVGASRVRDLFDQAKKSAPSIIFIDEIDAVGRQRGAGMGGGHDEREQTLNQLLVEMDGFAINQGVIIIAATNRPDILDPALLRPGRFDRQVRVSVPDVLGRQQILEVHTSKKPLAKDVNLKTLAKTTTGFSGADLENLANEAALLAARKDKKTISMREFEDSIIKVIAGPEKKARVITEKERKLTAFHEAGHAVITRLMPTQHPVHQISIIPRGGAGGYTMSLPKEDKYYTSKNEMIESITTLLGGRVAEKIVLDDISTGASNDIQRATKIARDIVTKYGMSDSLGTVYYSSENDEVFIGKGFVQGNSYSEQTASSIDTEVRKIIDSAYQKCEELLNQHRNILDKIAERLLEIEKIDGEEFETFFKEMKTTE